MAGGTDFFLEIQARMNAGQALSDIAALGKSIGDAKGKFTELEKTSLGVGTALDKVGAQVTANREKMSKAMAAGDTGAFWKAAGAAQALAAKEGELKTKAEQTKTALEAESASLRKLADSYAKVAAAERSEKEAGEAAKASSEQRKKGLEGLSKVKGPLGGIGVMVKDSAEAFEGLKGSLGSVGAGAVVALGPISMIATVLAAVGAAAAAATVGLAAYAVSQADAARNTRLTLTAITESAEAAATLKSAYSEVTLATGVQQDRLVALTRDLKKAKVSAKDLPIALKAIATQEAALEDTGGTGELIEKLKSGQTTAAKLAQDMDKKFGGVVEDKMLGLSGLFSTFKQNLKDLIPPFDIEPILKGLAKLVDLFNVNTSSGNALRALLETVFGPLQEGVDDIIPAVATALEAFFLRITIYTLKAINHLSALGNAFAPLLPTIKAAIAPIAEIGKNLVDGIVLGIQKAGGAIGGALVDQIKGAILIAKKVGAESSSPSKATERELADPMGQGTLKGVKKWTPMVHDALVDMATPPEAANDVFEDLPTVESRVAAAGSTAPTAKTVQEGDTYHVEITIPITGATDPEATAQLVARAVRDEIVGLRNRRGARRGARGRRAA